MNTKKSIILYALSLLLTLLLTRIILHLFPGINADLGNYNIHHIFPGSILLIIATILLLANIKNKMSIMLAGVGSSLILDEIIYLIITDGSDRAYITSPSLLGSLAFHAIALIMLYIIYNNAKK